MHEVQIHAAKSIPYDVVESSLRNTNTCCNEPEDVLTNQAYFYNRKNKRLEMIVDGKHAALDWIFE